MHLFRKKQLLLKLAAFKPHDGDTNIRLVRKNGTQLRMIRDPDMVQAEVVPARPGEEGPSVAPQGNQAPSRPWSEGKGGKDMKGIDPSKPVGTKPDTKHTKVASFFQKHAKKKKKTYPISRFVTSHGLALGGGVYGGARGAIAKTPPLSAVNAKTRRALLGALLGGGLGYGLNYLRRAIQARAMRGRAATGYKASGSEKKILKAIRKAEKRK